MKNTHLCFAEDGLVRESEYSLEAEAHVASLFTTGNGYIGVRGSLEEYGSLRIQGAYIRGFIDEIYELPQPFLDNEYMKKYYFDEDKLRRFEKEESVVNFADFLLLRFAINGETFYPWDGTLLSWERTLDMKSGRLLRQVRWQNSKGEITRFSFERFSSFADDHLYALRVTVMPENYSGTIEVLSGVDTMVKTNGQHVCIPVSSTVSGNRAVWNELSGPKYRFPISVGTATRLFNADGEMAVAWEPVEADDMVAVRVAVAVKPEVGFSVEKLAYTVTSRDVEEAPEAVVTRSLDDLATARYEELFCAHLAVYIELFDRIDVRITGDDEADRAVRFSNYHTLLTLARNDSVHSLSAKGLTGETYNNFVWWDCETYQAPIFFATMPELARNILLYRYRLLNQARENAKLEGRKGARFPFTSSVTGEETVWIYARHPFMQIHIQSDIAWGICRYFDYSGDEAFMKEYGLEMLLEIARYWVSRVEWRNDRYEIRCVTGTDEHHPYVDNNAYTNYSVAYTLGRTVELFTRYREAVGEMCARIGFSNEELDAIRTVGEKLYLPLDEKTGMIPQFDDYFDLSRDLEVAGGAAALSFQMKKSGLYNKSQTIKQPDTLLLFSYCGLKFPEKVYRRNWDYYQARCESASSLSYAVHAICAADLDLPESAYSYLLKTARLDFDDDHDCAWQGVHTACAAGAWLAVVRGVLGVEMRENGVEVHPHPIPWWNQTKASVSWHGSRLRFSLTATELTVLADASNEEAVPLFVNGETVSLAPAASYILPITLT